MATSPTQLAQSGKYGDLQRRLIFLLLAWPAAFFVGYGVLFAGSAYLLVTAPTIAKLADAQMGQASEQLEARVALVRRWFVGKR